ncbi:MAG: tRNA (N6-threonylcarbamoyladenosine(37)-N6)-methyltransferase TrmO [Anaerolineaceae bacterium]|nr:tRNA (N6-threonylcarbamoyladenosine(37)-N6)-methyltransferase TrmO [Anaerolineaceae bacterium]
MNEILTPNLRLIPLSKHQLFELLYSIENLEKVFSISIPRSLINEAVKRSINFKLDQRKKTEREDHIWLTYWLIQPLDEAIGVGLLEFKNIPNEMGRVEIGFGMDPSFENPDLLNEAVDHLCAWALEQPNCNLITATSVADKSTISILEKSGFMKMAQSPTDSLWHRYKDSSQKFPQLVGQGFQSIGIIHTAFESPKGTPIQPHIEDGNLASIILHPALTDGLKDLDGFSHIILLYVFDRITQPKLTVKPYMDDQDRGVFATRAPARPNPIGISVVRLVKIDGNLITFSGADMLNNTPLLDIKPYAPPFEPQTVERIGWLDQRAARLEESSDDGRFLEN